jgi:hypothetical protein
MVGFGAGVFGIKERMAIELMKILVKWLYKRGVKITAEDVEKKNIGDGV